MKLEMKHMAAGHRLDDLARRIWADHCNCFGSKTPPTMRLPRFDRQSHDLERLSSAWERRDVLAASYL